MGGFAKGLALGICAMGFIIATLSFLAPSISDIARILPYAEINGIVYGAMLFIGGILLWLGNAAFEYGSDEEDQE